ncbi:DNA primase [candidate division WOR-1 bacterium RIFOXYB2_FULL_42_35]|uniref:DNA primase n=1 Tax=candidate division WOR-1 bacterium RIFOXYC2_FULL_41_25 TaxID=1802586 RepID=A0A1F4TP64_UNCSA|nr:MAG: DNA primase [candidate division WOR-1 bacterium RIFOXYA2_FULL_41_14]OGC25078.1 MAG: DNA primase [candidate division WOR-1 bacterium RIFOXYB2_FULL_42_35]OGC34478.1 MAG: DNA primase [candidate division WOR-1 bacterium RIFOXYC2_FULL_41_25]
MIPKELIEEIRSKTDIVKIISEHVQLKKRGKNYVGLCPFHSEKIGSFTVSPEKQIFHCFGCNEGGNAFAFLMKLENIGFMEAVDEVGEKVGIAVPKEGRKPSSKNEQEKLYQVMKLAADFFQDCLQAETGQTAKEYLLKRAISPKTMADFGLGFAPAGWDNLFKHLVSRGVQPSLIEATGLIMAREGNNGYYDRFRERLIFPIVDQRKRVIAFGGRALGNEEPKYLNSPDTLIYHKGETVYGLNLTKENIKKAKTAVLVEGYFDLVTPFQNGINNIAASLGTALTTQQSKLLARYAETVIVAFDADAAGGIATERSVELLRNQNLNVKVAEFSPEKDPDEFINKQGVEAFQKCLADALPYLEYKIKQTLSRHNLQEIEGRSQALGEVARLLSGEKDPFVQKEYAKSTSRLLGTDIDSILAAVERLQQYSKVGLKNLRRVTEKPTSKLIKAEQNIVTLACQSLAALNLVKAELSVQDFNIPETRTIIEKLFETDFDTDHSISHFLLDNLADENIKKFLAGSLINEDLASDENSSTILSDCIKVIKDELFKDKIKILKLEIQAAEKAGNAEKAVELLSQLKSSL